MNPFTKEPCVFKTKPPNKAVRVVPMKIKLGGSLDMKLKKKPVTKKLARG